MTGAVGRRRTTPYTVTPAGCWEWLLAKNRQGYGLVSRGGRTRIAHIWFWEQEHGRVVPLGRELHHTCENPGCVNPGHLEALTRREHVARHSR